jgi:NAD(P)-dependent dehydrogenase (short-subunit alcohol dehydrogenase family)
LLVKRLWPGEVERSGSITPRAKARSPSSRIRFPKRWPKKAFASTASSTSPAKDVETLASMFHPVVPGQPEEVALSFVFLATDDLSCMTGQILHPNGGTVVNG